MVLLVFYIILGCFLDGISSVVLTMAVVEPMIRQAGIDLIWSAFHRCRGEMAQITPPIGFNLFVLQGMTHHEMNFIAKAAIPMFLIMVVMVSCLSAFPTLPPGFRRICGRARPAEQAGQPTQQADPCHPVPGVRYVYRYRTLEFPGLDTRTGTIRRLCGLLGARRF